MPETKHRCAPQNAPKFLDWIRNRGGVAHFSSIDLSDLDKSWSAPFLSKDDCPNCSGTGHIGDAPCGAPLCVGGKVRTNKPHWKSANNPDKVYTNTDDILVTIDKEVKRFHIAVRRGGNGLSLKVTDASTRKIREAVAKAGEGAYYEFDYATQEAVILKPDSEISLTEWATQNEAQETQTGA